jgi:branched-chain amino acid transport system ATP-binding protein
VSDVSANGDRPLLEIRDVTLRFKGLVALNKVSAEARPGQVTGIIGPNGAGKSSLLNCVNNFYHPQEGAIRFEGSTDLSRKRPYEIARLGIARTFQGLEVIRAASVIDNILLGRHIHMRRGVLWASLFYGPSRSEEIEHRRRAEEIMAFLEIGKLRHTRVGQLSYGQQKMVSIGRAMAMEPKLLLLDEPTAGLNFQEKGEVARLILRMKSEMGLTQVLIEHDVRLIGELCDYVYVLDFGNVIAEGPPATVLNDQRVIEAYLGTKVRFGTPPSDAVEAETLSS